MFTEYATLMPRRPSKKPHPRVPFSKDEDEKLKELVNQYGTNWNIVSEKMENRNQRQCKERWTHYLSPNVIMKPWTNDEDEFLKKKLLELGPKWVKLSSFFPNRTDIQLKNRWFVLMRKECKHKTKTGRKKYRNLQENAENSNYLVQNNTSQMVGNNNLQQNYQNMHENEFSFNMNSNEFQIFNDLLENMKWEQDFQV